VAQRLVGREAHLIEVDRFLDAAARHFSVLALKGPAGIGKTTVWGEARRRAMDGGALVLWCRPSPAEAKVSFAAVADMLSRVDDEHFAALPDPQREALEVVLMRRRPSSGRLATRATALGFLTLIRELAADRRLLLAVDDWQWLDPSSRQVFEFAARRLEDEPIGLLYSIRSPAAGLPPGGAADGRSSTLVLEPLSLAALGRILSDRLGRALPRPYLVRIAEASGGNPFYALEIARGAADSGVTHASGAAFVAVPEDLRMLTSERIRRLPADTRNAVLLAAVVSGPDRRSVELDALGPAEEAGIVTVDEAGRIEFTHPLLAAAAYGSVPAGGRRELHRQAAAVVSAPEERARHLALASAGADPAVAAQLDEGAATAAARGASGAAAELAELAARLTPSDDAAARHVRVLEAARYELDAGDLARSGELVNQLLAESPRPGVRARAFQLSSNLAARHSNFPLALELASTALELAGDDRRLRAEIELHLVYCSVSAGDFGGAEACARAAVADAEAIGHAGLLADTLAVQTMAEFLCGHGVDRPRLERALELEDPTMARSLVMRPRLIEGMLELFVGDLDRARDSLEAAHAGVAERGMESAAPMISLYLVWAYVWRGEFGLASSFAASSLEQAALLDDATVTGVALSAGALAHAHNGETALARQEAGEAIALFQQMQWRSAVIWPMWALGLAALSDGDPAGVHSLLGPLVEQVNAMGAGDPVLCMFVPDEVEALIALGELDLAETYLVPFERLAEDHRRGWAKAIAARCRGELAAARGSQTESMAAFDRSLAAYERTQMPFERARTQLAAGRALRRFRQRGRAAELLSTAAAGFDAAGAPAWAEQAKAELARTGRRRGETNGLTETERRLAELAASGLSNREVAARASVSIKTVESNLTRVYKKLGLRSRVELVDAMRDDHDSRSA
jgi:DNA-binding CsgD family transcriptional regulator